MADKLTEPKELRTISDCIPEDKAQRDNHYHGIARFAVYLNRARADMAKEGLAEQKMIIGVPFPDAIIYMTYATAYAERDGFDMNAAIDKWAAVAPEDQPDGEDTHN